MTLRHATVKETVTADSVCVIHPASAESMDLIVSVTITPVFASEENSAEVRSHV